MRLSSWMCANSKTMLLRIVHPGGRVEFHDRPVTAAEIMSCNPRSCVAHPHVFQQPWAIVSPDRELMLGEKYYIVPKSTIRKLQRLSPSPRQSPSPAREISIGSPIEEVRDKQSRKDKEDDDMIPTCCIFRNITNKSNGSRRTQDLAGHEFRGSAKKAWSSENWQPSLESITEE